MNNTFASSPSTRRSWNLKPVDYGYIGMDIGSDAIRIAQNYRKQGICCPSGQWQLPLAAEHRPAGAAGLAAALQYLQSQWHELRPLFRGNRVAVTLPVQLMPIRTLEIPAGTRSEMQAMIRDELNDDRELKAPFTFAFWHSKGEEDGVANVTVVVVDYEISQIVNTQLLHCGLECWTLDALPCVLARAAAAAEQSMPSVGCSAVLDLASNASQLVFCEDGQPGFCRLLTGTGMANITEQLETRLQLTAMECDLLLSELGMSELQSQCNRPSIVGPMITHTIEQIVHEVERTLTFASAHYAEQFPQQIWLTGVGAEICDLASYIAKKLAIDVHVLDRPGAAIWGQPAVFAAAHCLSSACWETPACK